MKSALTHLQEVATFKNSGQPGTAYVGVGLTRRGYDVLGIPGPQQPSDGPFQRGMTDPATIGTLEDPAVADWEAPFQDPVDAVVLVGDTDQAQHDTALARVSQMIAARPSITIAATQTGKGQHNARGEGLEHFGYVDGRSQPLFFEEDIAEETLTKDGATNWDPGFGLGRAVVPDPAAPDPATDFGSYFVFRKLEQNVRRFKAAEDALADELGLTGSDRERAGAMVVGRFEDGTPVAIQSADGMHSPVPNDFTYDSDPEGGKCPFFAHIRKMNPRGSGGFEAPDDERLHIMARRGQTYGERTDDLNEGGPETKPTGGVGLLFMAFNASLTEQFEFVQRLWANNAGFPEVPSGATAPGLDLVIGQGARPGIACPVQWGDPASKHMPANPLPQAVTMLGGEYFFMPSLAFLQSMGQRAAAA